MTKARSEASAPMTWVHKGIVITMRQQWGDFEFTVGVKHHTSASLDGAKKKITELLKDTFTPFAALEVSFDPDRWADQRHYGTSVIEISVTALQKNRERGWARFQFLFTRDKLNKNDLYSRGRDGSGSAVHPATDECRAAIATYMDLCVENKRIVEVMKKQERHLHALIPVIRAADYDASGKLVIAIPANEKGDE